MNKSFDNVFNDGFASNKETLLNNSLLETKIKKKLNSKKNLNYNSENEPNKIPFYKFGKENMYFFNFEDFENEPDLVVRNPIIENIIFLNSQNHFEKLGVSFVFVFDLKIREAEENFEKIKGNLFVLYKQILYFISLY